jgi:hypothetical protein
MRTFNRIEENVIDLKKNLRKSPSMSNNSHKAKQSCCQGHDIKLY